MPSLATSVAVPSSSYRIILAVPLPKCRRASLVAAANTASGGSPRATSVASRRSAAWVSASLRSCSSAWALAIASRGEFHEVRHARLGAGREVLPEVAATVTPQKRPSTTMGVATAARMPSRPTTSPNGPEASMSPLIRAGRPVRSAAVVTIPGCSFSRKPTGT